MTKYAALLMVLILLSASACAPRSMSLGEVRGLCFTHSAGGGLSSENNDSGGGGACGDISPICEAFLDEAVLAPLGRDACIAACESSRTEQQRIHLTDGCYPYVKRGYELCDVYCRGKR